MKSDFQMTIYANIISPNFKCWELLVIEIIIDKLAEFQNKVSINPFSLYYVVLFYGDVRTLYSLCIICCFVVQ